MAYPDSDEDYFLPLQDQRVFGAGIKRKRIDFVPASTSDLSQPTSTRQGKTDIGSRYLSIVLPQSRTDSPDTTASTTPEVTDLPSERPSAESSAQPSPLPTAPELCPVCAQPITSTHESSIAHQVCLQHVHPPSHLPRSHVGVRYLSSYGWDPDARRGLGA